MSHNRFGHLLTVTTWGESHGPALGCVIDGCPPNIPLSVEDIQPFLDQRKPGGSRHVTQRREDDLVEILSGVFKDDRTGGQVTTGTPISLMIRNTDQRSKDYSDIRDKWRPGHADYTYDAKYGVRDYRGGGRSSARETAARVAAGGVARKILGPDIQIRAALTQIGPRKIDTRRWDWSIVHDNPFFCPDPDMIALWEADMDAARKAGSSLGAMVEVVISGLPPGWGAPVYGKLDNELASAMMSINAVKGVEIGTGMEAAGLSGDQAGDEMVLNGEGQIEFPTNYNGGILGGISTGQDVIVRFAVKPTSSVRIEKQSLTRDLHPTSVATHGRHDPCVGIRAVPVGEAMAALVLADQKLRHRGQIG
ncbi:chorismate synthase [Woodsholea maritima]|uniref:chorismate synthase n=1 Tax=Woodsholea maritima TaxID=240237 RepID=UPI000378B444|nr:chorismate synthase [Woodsholea maritima]